MVIAFIEKKWPPLIPSKKRKELRLWRLVNFNVSETYMKKNCAGHIVKITLKVYVVKN